MRDMTVDAQFALESTQIRPIFLVKMAFSNEPILCHTGVGDLVYAGDTYKGVGQLGSVSGIGESSDLQAQGIVLTLSGVPLPLGASPNFLNDALLYSTTYERATVMLGILLNDGSLLADPIVIYAGQCDQPTIDASAETITVSIAIENKLSDLQRARGGRYTNADQKRRHPSDNGLKYVQFLNDMFLNWRQ